MTSPTPSNSSQSNSDTELNGTSSIKCSSCNASVSSASARTLPCYHTFCRHCHDQLQTSGAGGAYVSCPACLSAAATQGGPATATRPTGVCRGCSRNDKAVVELVAKCVTCDYRICASCERSHREMGYFSRHQVVALSPPPPPTSTLAVGGPARSGPMVDVSAAGPSSECPVHTKEPLAFFCHHCKVAMCRHCCLLDDPTHQKSVLTSATSNAELSATPLNGADVGGLSYLEKVAETKAAHLRVAAKNVENALVFQQEQHQMAKDAVNDAYSVFLKALDDRRAETLRELDLVFADKQVGAKTILQEVKAVLDVFLQARSILALFPANSSSAEAALLRQTLVDRMTGFINYKPQLELLDTSDVAFITDLSAMHAAVHGVFGTVRCARRPVMQQDQDCPLPYPAGHRTSPFDLADVLSAHNSSADSVLSSLDIGRLAMSSSSAPRRSGSPAMNVDRWGGGGGSSSSSSKAAPDIFAMADMFIADIEGRSSSGKATPPVSMVQRQKISYHCQFGDSGEGDGQFTEPSGVAVNMINGDILVADANNHRVQVFDRQGDFLFRIGSVGKHDGALVYPNRVAVCRLTGNIVITERSPTHQVQIFTRDGAFVRKFGSHILQNPRGVTVDRLGNIIVVECKVQRVIVFCQQTGTILHKFSIMETVEFPNGVAASNGCDKIYISDNQSHCVKVFSYDGTPLGVIGGQGVTNYPIGVGVGPQGEVIVADNHNNFNLTVFSSSGKLLGALESTVKHNQCYNVAFADDGTVVVACKDNHVFVYQYFVRRTSPNAALSLSEFDIHARLAHSLPTACLS